jgi:hypothetical protein
VLRKPALRIAKPLWANIKTTAMKETRLIRLINTVTVKNLKLIILIPLFLTLFILLYQQFFINEYRNVNVITLHPNTKNFKNELKDRLKKYDIKMYQKINVFLPSTESDYNKMTLFMKKGTLGINFGLFDIVFINPNIPITRKRLDILVHEIGHSYLKQEFGYFHIFTTEKWKQEGFCEYISESSTFPREEGLSIFKDNKLKILELDKLRRSRYDYFTYRLVFEFLIKDKGMTLHQIFESDFDFELLKNEIRNKMSAHNKS